MAYLVNTRQQFLRLQGKVKEYMAQTEATIKSKVLKLALFWLRLALMDKTNNLCHSYALEAVTILPHLGSEVRK